MPSNPLSEPSGLPHDAPAFDRITPEDFLPAQKALQDEAAAKIEAIKNNPEPPTFANTVEALEYALQPLRQLGYLRTMLESAGADPDYAALAQDYRNASIAFNEHCNLMDPVLFARIDAVFRQKGDLGLDEEQKIFLTSTHDEFLRDGIMLPAPVWQAANRIDQELAKLQKTFSDNVTAENPGGSTYLARAMAHLRQKNAALVPDILRLRQEKARLLGYENCEAQTICNSMAGSVDKVEESLASLEKGYKSLSESRSALCNDEAIRALRFRPEEVRQRLQTVIRKYFGLEVRDLTDSLSLCRHDLKIYEISNGTGKTEGLLYVDAFDHPGRKGASGWSMPVRKRSAAPGQDGTPIAFVSLKFPKNNDDSESDLTFANVKAMFHEWGHALQFLTVRGRYPSLTGTSPADSVEIFSTLMEKLLTTAVLTGIARDQSGQKIGHRQLAKILGDYEVARAEDHLRSVQGDRLDIALHSLPGDVPRSFDELISRLAKATSQPEDSIGEECCFNNWLFGSASHYAGLNFGYEWAEMAAATAVDKFSSPHGLFNKPGAKAALRELFATSAAGGNAAKAFRTIVGCDPDPAAPFRQYPEIAASLRATPAP